jgi:hypothetical protein
VQCGGMHFAPDGDENIPLLNASWGRPCPEGEKEGREGKRGEGGGEAGRNGGKGSVVQGDELKGEMDRLFGPEE